jgi:phosphomethylpyrimidine synthase
MTKKKDNAPAQEVITRKPLPASRKHYVPGTIHAIRVAMREISLTETRHGHNGSTRTEENAPIYVYDTSGPYTDPTIQIDLKQGLPRLRESWIRERGDVEELADYTSEYGRQRLSDTTLDHLRFAHLKRPLRAKDGANVSQLHYARKGMITP